MNAEPMRVYQSKTDGSIWRQMHRPSYEYSHHHGEWITFTSLFWFDPTGHEAPHELRLCSTDETEWNDLRLVGEAN